MLHVSRESHDNLPADDLPTVFGLDKDPSGSYESVGANDLAHETLGARSGLDGVWLALDVCISRSATSEVVAANGMLPGLMSQGVSEKGSDQFSDLCVRSLGISGSGGYVRGSVSLVDCRDLVLDWGGSGVVLRTKEREVGLDQSQVELAGAVGCSTKNWLDRAFVNVACYDLSLSQPGFDLGAVDGVSEDGGFEGVDLGVDVRLKNIIVVDV